MDMHKSLAPSGGSFIPNKKKTDFAKSVAIGMQGTSLSSITKNGGILESLGDEANLPAHLDELDKKDFNEKNFCELCDRNFARLKGINRHHCRKCNRSVC